MTSGLEQRTLSTVKVKGHFAVRTGLYRQSIDAEVRYRGVGYIILRPFALINRYRKITHRYRQSINTHK